jgi:DNA-binding MarR family transcriptional regulator
MSASRLSQLQRRILQTIYEAEASRQWTTSPSHYEVRQAVGGNQGNFSVSLRNLEAKGLITVYRNRGGQADSVWLTKAGKKRASNLAEVLIKERSPTKS